MDSVLSAINLSIPIIQASAPPIFTPNRLAPIAVCTCRQAGDAYRIETRSIVNARDLRIRTRTVTIARRISDQKYKRIGYGRSLW